MDHTGIPLSFVNGKCKRISTIVTYCTIFNLCNDLHHACCVLSSSSVNSNNSFVMKRYRSNLKRHTLTGHSTVHSQFGDALSQAYTDVASRQVNLSFFWFLLILYFKNIYLTRMVRLIDVKPNINSINLARIPDYYFHIWLYYFSVRICESQKYCV